MSLQIPVSIPATGLTKVIRFAAAESVHDALRTVREKVGDDSSTGKDHALVLLTPSRRMCEAVWLDPTKTLEFYDLTRTDTLEYRKRHQSLKVTLADGAERTMRLDVSLPHIDLVNAVCEKIGLPNGDEYAFQGEEAPGVWLPLDKPLSESTSTLDQAFVLKRRFFYFDEADQQGSEQELTGAPTPAGADDDEGGGAAAAGASAASAAAGAAAGGKRDAADIRRVLTKVTKNPVQLSQMYCQARDEVVAGKHPCTLDEALQLAALQLAADLGDSTVVPGARAPGAPSVDTFMPPPYRKDKRAEKGAAARLEDLRRDKVTGTDARFKYLVHCQQMPTWGLMLFRTIEVVAPDGSDPAAALAAAAQKKSKKPIQYQVARYLAIAKDRIIRFERRDVTSAEKKLGVVSNAPPPADPKNLTAADIAPKEIIAIPFRKMKRWNANPKSITIDFGDIAPILTAHMEKEGESAKIADSIAGYIRLMQRAQARKKKFETVDDAQVATVSVGGLVSKVATVTTSTTTVTELDPQGSFFDAAKVVEKIAQDVMQSFTLESVPQAAALSADQRGQVNIETDRLRAALEKLRAMGLQSGFSGGTPQQAERMRQAIKVAVASVTSVLNAARAAGVASGGSEAELLLQASNSVQNKMRDLFTLVHGLETATATEMTAQDREEAVMHAVSAVEAALAQLDGVARHNAADATQESLVREVARAVRKLTDDAADMALLAVEDDAALAGTDGGKRAMQAARTLHKSGRGVADVGDQLALLVLENEPRALGLLTTSLKLVDGDMDNLLKTAQAVGVNAGALEDIQRSKERLQAMLDALRQAGQMPDVTGAEDAASMTTAAQGVLRALTDILHSTDAEISDSSDAAAAAAHRQRVLKSGAIVKRGMQQLGQSARGVAGGLDAEAQERMGHLVGDALDGARSLLRNVAALGRQPGDLAPVKAARADALELAAQLQALMEDAGREIALASLYTSAKRAATATIRLSGSVHRARGTLGGDMAAEEGAALLASDATTAVGKLLTVLREAKEEAASAADADGDDMSAAAAAAAAAAAERKKHYRVTEALVEAADAFAPIMYKTVAAVPRQVTPKTQDAALSEELKSDTTEAGRALHALLADRKQMKTVAAQLEAAEAMESFATAVAALDTAKLTAESNMLDPDSVEGAADLTATQAFRALVADVKQSSAQTKGLVSTTQTSPEATGKEMRVVAQAYTRVIDQGIALAAVFHGDRTNQKAVLNQTAGAAQSMQHLLRQSKTFATQPGDERLRQLLLDAGGAVAASLADLAKSAQVGVEAATGADKKRDDAEAAHVRAWRELEEKAAAALRTCAQAVNEQNDIVARALEDAAENIALDLDSDDEDGGENDAGVGEPILEAVNAIVASTKTLAVNGATVQTEFLSLIGETGQFYKRDARFPQALIDAAEHVTKAATATVAATTGATPLAAGEERTDVMAAGAEDLAEAVQELVRASTAEKSGAGAAAEASLREAAQTVTTAIQHLILALKGRDDAIAAAALAPSPHASSYELPDHLVDQLRQQEHILKLQNDLRRAREKMHAIQTKPEE